MIYYAIANLAALKIPNEERLYPEWLACLWIFVFLGRVANLAARLGFNLHGLRLAKLYPAR